MARGTSVGESDRLVEWARTSCPLGPYLSDEELRDAAKRAWFNMRAAARDRPVNVDGEALADPIESSDDVLRRYMFECIIDQLTLSNLEMVRRVGAGVGRRGNLKGFELTDFADEVADYHRFRQIVATFDPARSSIEQHMSMRARFHAKRQLHKRMRRERLMLLVDGYERRRADLEADPFTLLETRMWILEATKVIGRDGMAQLLRYELDDQSKSQSARKQVQRLRGRLRSHCLD